MHDLPFQYLVAIRKLWRELVNVSLDRFAVSGTLMIGSEVFIEDITDSANRKLQARRAANQGHVLRRGKLGFNIVPLPQTANIILNLLFRCPLSCRYAVTPAESGTTCEIFFKRMRSTFRKLSQEIRSWSRRGSRTR